MEIDEGQGIDLVLKKISMDEKQEAKVLIDFIEQRIKKRLACNIICTSEPGKGKSYSGLRLLELWYRRWFDENFPTSHICKDLETAILIVRDFKRKGEGILIEELSVLAGARDSLTRQNKLWNKFIDIIRIKQAIIVGNAPFLSFVDKHIIALSQVWLDILGVNFRKKVTVCKAKILQQPSFKHEPYQHSFVDSEGDPVGLIVFRKPSEELYKFYDTLKIKSVDDTCDELVEKMMIDRRKQLKEMGRVVLAWQEEQDYNARLNGLTTREIAEKRGVSVDTVGQNIRNARIKLNISKNKAKSLRKSRKLP